MKQAFADQSLAHKLARRVLSKHDGERPHFVVVTSWFGLHEYYHSGGEMDLDLIHKNNMLNDYYFRNEKADCAQVFGFRNDEAGKEAIRIIQGWQELDVWVLDANSILIPFDLNQLGENPHVLSLDRPQGIENAVTEAVLLTTSQLAARRRLIIHTKNSGDGAWEQDIPF